MEYALLIAAVAVVVLGVVIGLADLVQNAFSGTSSCLGSGGSSSCATSTSP